MKHSFMKELRKIRIVIAYFSYMNGVMDLTSMLFSARKNENIEWGIKKSICG